MKKLLTVFLSTILIVMCFSGCTNRIEPFESDGEKLSIISTIFPGYDFARQICGENAEVVMLLPPGAESHSFEPSVQDIIKIQNCDLFIYNGGESDSWIDKILTSANRTVNTVRMMDFVNVVNEEIVEGMQAESGTVEEPEYDEHIWTSPKNAVKIVNGISDAVCEVDIDNTNIYRANAAAYAEKLILLDKRFAEFFMGVKNKTMIFGDRFPLRYFADAYGIEYYAAFPGCSSESEPGAATIAFLIDKVKSENIPTVFYIEFSNHKAADIIAESAGANTALFHSCHNVSSSDLKNGASYITLMEQNLMNIASLR